MLFVCFIKLVWCWGMLHKHPQCNSMTLYTQAKSISWTGREQTLLCVLLCAQQSWENLRFIVSKLLRPGSSKRQGRSRLDSSGLLPPCLVWVLYYTSVAWNDKVTVAGGIKMAFV